MNFLDPNTAQLDQQHFDVIIVGGGMVGASLAAGFEQQGKKVLVVESYQPEPEILNEAPLRVSAVNRFSENWLKSVACWEQIHTTNKCQFNRLATWEQGTPVVEFSATEIGESHLGFLVRNEALQLAAYEQLLKRQVNVLFGAKLKTLSQTNNQVTMTLFYGSSGATKEFILTAGLVIGADGANSAVRALANIGSTGWNYQQRCFSLTLKTDFETQDITWQQFQPSGPKAFLPLNNGYACLIWYDNPKTIKQLESLPLAQLKEQVLQVFPALPGDFEIVKTASFPLTRRQANQYFNNRVVLVGDAAHAINPLAGQGVNLGYKDNAELLKLLEDVNLNEIDSNENDFEGKGLAEAARLRKRLAKYQLKRKADSLVMSSVMDGFYQMFSNEKSVHSLIRKSALNIVNSLPLVKKTVLKKALGF